MAMGRKMGSGRQKNLASSIYSAGDSTTRAENLEKAKFSRGELKPIDDAFHHASQLELPSRHFKST